MKGDNPTLKHVSLKITTCFPQGEAEKLMRFDPLVESCSQFENWYKTDLLAYLLG